jgi:alpha-L-fucosidase 2
VALARHRPVPSPFLARYHYNSGIEVLAAMLEYQRHTQSTTFARSTLLPFAREVLEFYRSQ